MYQWPGTVRELIKKIGMDELLTLASQFVAFEENEGKLLRVALRQAIQAEHNGLLAMVGMAGEQAKIESIQCAAREQALMGFLREGCGLLDLLKEEIQKRSAEGKK
jgi:hypothetical protein